MPNKPKKEKPDEELNVKLAEDFTQNMLMQTLKDQNEYFELVSKFSQNLKLSDVVSKSIMQFKLKDQLKLYRVHSEIIDVMQELADKYDIDVDDD